MRPYPACAAIIFLCPILAGTAAHAQDGTGKVVSSTHYETVDCNAVSTRQTMLKEYNDRLPAASANRVIDVLEQKRLYASPSSLACYGSYSFSDGTSKKITYKEMVNSLGQTVWTFTPDSW